MPKKFIKTKKKVLNLNKDLQRNKIKNIDFSEWNYSNSYSYYSSESNETLKFELLQAVY